MCLHQDAPPLARRSFLCGLGVGLATVGCTLTPSGDTAFILISESEEQALGLQSWQEIRRSTQASTDSRLRTRLNTVGARIVSTLGENPAWWEFEVFRGAERNAFALPGRKVGFFEGIFEAMDNDAQVAAVLGHEVGHNQARHGAQRVSAHMATQLGVNLAAAALQAGSVQSADTIAAALGVGAQFGVLLPYSRQHELDADRLGVTYMARADYDPREAITFWQNMEREAASRPPEFLSTHPAPGNRIAQLERLMPNALRFYRA